MQIKKTVITTGLLTLLLVSTSAIRVKNELRTGAMRMEAYIEKLQGKKVGMVVNQTSVMAGEHIVDVLKENEINITTIFGPEHGFRGTADAGEKVGNATDAATGIPVISLYGNHKKPSAADLKEVDIVVFDIQDVGARFYTYISTLQYVMEACAENKKKLIVLDRPNPNGHYVDGPVLNTKHKSFVGMQAIPIVHGMTIGEYAKMLNGEKLLANKVKCDLEVITCTGYTHKLVYNLPIPPSPNLKTMASIYYYPSLCLFEGTEVSVGRGTDTPFEMWGHPSYTGQKYNFTPKPNIGSKDPLYNGKTCYGMQLPSNATNAYNKVGNTIHLEWLIAAYKLSKDKSKFFNSFFTNLAGNTTLQEQIKKGTTEAAIRKTWKTDLDKFKKVRKKYLIYPDFE
jgi:uncharacterized protein YbbC (DUF1343 family)